MVLKRCSFVIVLFGFFALSFMISSIKDTYAEEGKFVVISGEEEVEFPTFMYYLLSPSLQSTKQLGSLDSLMKETVETTEALENKPKGFSDSPRKTKFRFAGSPRSYRSKPPCSPRPSGLLRENSKTKHPTSAPKVDEPSSPRMIKVGRIEMPGVDPHLLKALSDIVRILPEVARDCNGRVVLPEDINGDTIFVTKLLRARSKEISDKVLEAYMCRKMEDKSGEASSSEDKRTPRDKRGLGARTFSRTFERFSLALSGDNGRSLKLNQTWGDLYRLAADLEMKPVSNLLAHLIVNQLPMEGEVSLQGALYEEQYGSFSTVQLGYLRKHLALKELGVQERTVADYIGQYGWNKVLQSGVIRLSNKQLTSIDGLQMLCQHEPITQIRLSGNHLLSGDLDPDYSDKLFKGCNQHLKTLYLKNNCLTSFPQEIVDHLPALEKLSVRENFLPRAFNLRLSDKVTYYHADPRKQDRRFGFK